MFKVIVEEVAKEGTAALQKALLQKAVDSFQEKLNSNGITEVISSAVNDTVHGVTFLAIVKFDEPKKSSVKK